MEWTFEAVPQTNLQSFRVSIRSEHPWLARELLALFSAAKERCLDQLRAAGPAADPARLRQMAIVGDDPLPYGMPANRKAAEMLLEFAADQKLTPRVYRVDELFDASTAST